ncbi:cytochrome c oxidase accessory protein CcoG [Niveibacterium sp. 24ML]|uniref:cytochrome c oxidase accessory protein CcoG n=1 Tax=Niveibacterium sp. 24ML TaxID=2985512 RepID=UPI00226ED683|nr:cytochrome c oxidase accessory protein CcoG [Niveibacterium sp. 24ML]MCX9157041.1 cytochrome c oxidase accessory protein CcoG [Niveibacterium sp. 24ML]
MNDHDPTSASHHAKPKIKAKTIPIRQVGPAGEEDLYEIRKKVYPRAVTGVFATWRWALVWFTQLVFYGFCWLEWNDRQAVLFDLANRKFYIFALVFSPQDVFFLAILLIICAYALFLFTAIAGRLWCGFACPQTVYTQIFIWIEQKIEGGRNQQIKLDEGGWGSRKAFLKTSKYLAWGLVSLWTGITFVGYFTPIKELIPAFISWRLGGWEVFWIAFYGGFTYLMAGVMREQVCKYMCPYARFQGVMFDPDTLVITYDKERGDPRGARRKGADHAAQGLGDCVDCGICVQVCPTGIDIRDGLQYECIGCAACIDACDQVMEKMQYAPGLIRYSTENAVKKHWGRKEILAHVMRPRTLIYSGVLCAICIAFVWGLTAREPLRLDVIRDRSVLTREVEDGLIENAYTLQLMSVSERQQKLVLSVSGLEGIRLVGHSAITLPPAATQAVTVQVRVPADTAAKGAHKIFFELRSDDQEIVLREKSTFLMP